MTTSTLPQRIEAAEGAKHHPMYYPWTSLNPCGHHPMYYPWAVPAALRAKDRADGE